MSSQTNEAQKLSLEIKPQPSPDTLAWLNNGTEIKVSKKVSFIILHWPL